VARKRVDAKAKRRGGAARGESLGTLSDIRLVANLLGLHLVRGETFANQASLLTAAGYSVADVAALLRVPSNNVSVALYKSTRRKSRRGAGTSKSARK